MSTEAHSDLTELTNVRSRVGYWSPVLWGWALSLFLHFAFIVLLFVFAGLRSPVSAKFDESRGVALDSRSGMTPEDIEAALVRLDTYDSTVVDEAMVAVDPEEDAPEQVESEGDTEDEEETVEGDPDVEDDPDDTSEDETEEPAVNTPDIDERMQAALEHQRQVEAEERARRRRARRERARERERANELEARAEATSNSVEGTQGNVENAAQRAAEAAREAALGRETTAEAGETNTSTEVQDVDPSTLPPAQRFPEGTLNPIATDIGMWGPEGARVVLILRNDRIRSSPHARNVRRLLEASPDWNDLLGESDIDPLRQIDSMLIASADPRRTNRTFIAGVHQIRPTEITAALGEGFPGGVDWSVEDDRIIGRPRDRGNVIDPRIFYVPTENVFVYTRPEYLRGLRRRAPTPRGLSEAIEAIESEGTRGSDAGAAAEADAPDTGDRGDSRDTPAPQNVGPLARGPLVRGGPRVLRPPNAPGAEGAEAANNTPPPLAAPPRVPARSRAPGRVRPDDNPPERDAGWIRGLREMTDLGGTDRDGPAIQITTGALSEFNIRGLSGIGPPSAMHVSITAENDPVMTGRMVFQNREDAERFVAGWGRILNANQTQLRITGMYRPFSDAEWEIDFNEATFKITLPRATVDRFAASAAAMTGNR